MLSHHDWRRAAVEYVLVGLVSGLAAGLTLFSGFGLGTILLPAFALYLPIEVAVAATAVVHLLNNLLKVVLVGRWASRQAVLWFGLPAIPAALGGGAMLVWLATIRPLGEYTLGPAQAEITPAKLVIAVLIGVFGLLELRPARADGRVSGGMWLVLGGVLSGFFGGVSGHQGALRSAFLVRTDLDPQRFVGTNAVLAVMVDVARLSMYALGMAGMSAASLREPRVAWLAGVAVVCAWAGSFVGARLVRKVTLRSLRLVVAVMLIVIALLLGAGLI